MRAAINTTIIVLIAAIAMAVAGRKAASAKATNGPFRDGLYLGKLMAKRGDNRQIPFARWANAADRASFASGYEEGYAQQIATASNRGRKNAQGTMAPYQDGLYLGRLDATQGRSQHVAAGRWSNMEDRSSFTNGYIHGYNGVTQLYGGNAQAYSQDVAAE